MHVFNRCVSLSAQGKEVEDEQFRVDKDEEINAPQERNGQGAGHMTQRGEFICFEFYFYSGIVLVLLTFVLCVYHMLGLVSPESDRNDTRHTEAPTCTHTGQSNISPYNKNSALRLSVTVSLNSLLYLFNRNLHGACDRF